MAPQKVINFLQGGQQQPSVWACFKEDTTPSLGAPCLRRLFATPVVQPRRSFGVFHLEDSRNPRNTPWLLFCRRSLNSHLSFLAWSRERGMFWDVSIQRGASELICMQFAAGIGVTRNSSWRFNLFWGGPQLVSFVFFFGGSIS